MKVIETNSEKITITGYRNGFEEGFVQKKQNGKLSSEKYKFVRNIEPLWFTVNSINIFKNIGIETTVQRAKDFSNLFDGSLNGYYYLSMSKQDNSTSDENAKIILGYISETFNNRKIDIKSINYIIPAPWLKQLIFDIETNKVPKKFQKEFVDEFIEYKDKTINPTKIIEELLKLPRYEVMDNSLIEGFIDTVFKEYPQAVEDAINNPKKSGWLTGQVMKISERKASPQEAAKLINDRLEKIKNGK